MEAESPGNYFAFDCYSIAPINHEKRKEEFNVSKTLLFFKFKRAGF